MQHNHYLYIAMCRKMCFNDSLFFQLPRICRKVDKNRFCVQWVINSMDHKMDMFNGRYWLSYVNEVPNKYRNNYREISLGKWNRFAKYKLQDVTLTFRARVRLKKFPKEEMFFANTL